jgi:hypothetical protein
MPGLKITPKSAGRLFHLLDEINARYPQPVIERIVITERYELKLQKLPNIGLPICTHNTLAIGLPLLLTLSPNQFKCLLTREIIQYSKRRKKLANWLNQLRDSWDFYPMVLKQRACIGHQLLYGFFTVYNPLYKAISQAVHIADELRADRNTLDLINSDELLSALQAKLIAQVYFENHFWPSVTRTSAAPRPFQRLNLIAKSELSQSNSEAWLQQHSLNTKNIDVYYPTLQQRMKNLGLTSAKLPPNLTQTAADYYLENHLTKIINLWDNNWLQGQHGIAAKRFTNNLKKQPARQPVKPPANLSGKQLLHRPPNKSITTNLRTSK